MAKSLYLSAFAAFVVCGVSAQTQYGQAGQVQHIFDVDRELAPTSVLGGTTCPTNWTCTVLNAYYSQCLPGSATTTTPTTTISTTSTRTTSTTSTGTAPTGTPTTLMPGWSFVRAVEDPEFHKYLMSQTPGTSSTAVLGDYTLAPQFQVVSGQLIQYTGGTNLYAIVEPPANSSVTKLGLHWATTPDTLGTWSSPTVVRQQTNAWLVCPSGTALNVYINLGCSDETLNAYTGATAVP
ncbi:Carbohydrate-binding module family 1 protein [Mycena sanguinolenta]|uniref:Carbohydrate-binding module family 1 protein n=1 Tax=Mycena sanguinolenta TaxID=230812 RepID=A0A8H6YXG0_9AGAR|nr:Carbohydrate-binding module family 1 protein [Mycena sanguinolenta]